MLLSGDLLFAGSIGRVDLPGGSMAAMERSLLDVVLALDDATVVLPGHGPTTTIARERATRSATAGARSIAALAIQASEVCRPSAAASSRPTVLLPDAISPTRTT